MRLVLLGQAYNPFLVGAISKNFLCSVLVERAAHTSIGGLHGEYAGTAYLPPLPHALFDEGMHLIFFRCYVGDIKAGKL